MWPGLGHFYVTGGLDLKGLILAGSAVILALLGIVPLIQMSLVLMGVRGASGSNGTAAFGLLFAIIWVYAIGDSVVQAQRSSASQSDRLGF